LPKSHNPVVIAGVTTKPLVLTPEQRLTECTATTGLRRHESFENRRPVANQQTARKLTDVAMTSYYCSIHTAAATVVASAATSATEQQRY